MPGIHLSTGHLFHQNDSSEEKLAACLAQVFNKYLLNEKVKYSYYKYFVNLILPTQVTYFKYFYRQGNCGFLSAWRA